MWGNIFTGSSWVISIIAIMIGMSGDLTALAYFGLIIVIYFLGFIATQQYIYRIKAEEREGVDWLDGWIDLSYDRGEEILWGIEKVGEFPELPESVQEAVDKFVDEMEVVINQYNIDIENLTESEMEFIKDTINLIETRLKNKDLENLSEEDRELIKNAMSVIKKQKESELNQNEVDKDVEQEEN